MNTIKSQEQIINMIVNWAVQTANIRAVILAGEHGNHQINSNPLATYHFQCIVNELNTMIWQEEWLQTFGEPLTTLQHIRHHSVTGAVACTQNVLYTDGIEIEFQIYPVSEWENQIDNESSSTTIPGYQVLLDKDHRIQDSIVVPEQQSVRLNKPVRHEYEQIQHEFWWYCMQTAKSLLQQQMLLAKYQLDHILRIRYLEKMLDWYAGSQHQWDIMYHHDRVGYRQQLEPELAQALVQTYAGNHVEENWNSLLHMIHLFRTLSVYVAEVTGYTYDHEQDQRMITYLHQLKNK